MTEPTRAVDPMIAELEQEAQATRRILERVPEDKLTWKPHSKSMTLGQLAGHVAGMFEISGFLEMDGLDVDQVTFANPQPESRAALLQTFESGLTAARQRLGGLDDCRAAHSWRLHKSGAEIFTMRKIDVMRTLLLNHLYHHRGQLSVYLRLLDVPLPVVYGRTADENPFASM